MTLFLFKRLNYHQKAGIAIACFLLSLSISFFLMVSSQQKAINRVNKELNSLPYLQELIKTIEEFCLHKIMLDRYLLQNPLLKGEISKLQQQIDASFKTLVLLDAQAEEALKTTPHQLKELSLSSLKPIDLQRSWDTLRSKAFELTLNTSEKLHSEMITSLTSLLIYLAGSSEFILEDDIDRFYLGDTALTLLPKQMNTLSSLISASFQAFKTKEISVEKLSAVNVLKTIALFRNMEIHTALKQTFLANKHGSASEKIEPRLKELLDDYLRSTQVFIEMIEINTLNGTNKTDPQAIIAQGLTVFDLLTSLDNEILSQLERMLKEARSSLRLNLFLCVTGSLGCMALGLLIGIYLLLSIDRSLKLLKEATEKLAVGDLSARVPSLGSDEIGQIGENFNKLSTSFEELMRWLQWTGIQLTTSTTEIAAAAKEQENTITYQEATTKQIAVTANQISSTAKAFAKTMSDVSAMAEQTSSLAASGKEGLIKMEEVVSHMAEASGNIAAKLSTLNDKTSSITSIISTIAKVADQTNLLSLNAAIEAEKAGEHGRSFSVIAREIRRLADQIANATIDIEKMINEMVSAVSASVMGVDKFSKEIHTGVGQIGDARELMSKIMEQVQHLTNGLETVNQGTQAQSLGAEQITNSINMLSETTQATTHSIRQFHKAIEELSHAARELQSTIAKVKK